jgi:cell division cycle protein 37
MSNKPQRAFDYSKWDNIELSDDEDDVHPNIERESWFRMKHRSRVEREENEAKDKANIQAQVSNKVVLCLKCDF